MNFYLVSQIYLMELMEFEQTIEKLIGNKNDWFETIVEGSDKSLHFVGTCVGFRLNKSAIAYIWQNGFDKIYIHKDYNDKGTIYKMRQAPIKKQKIKDIDRTKNF